VVYTVFISVYCNLITFMRMDMHTYRTLSLSHTHTYAHTQAHTHT